MNLAEKEFKDYHRQLGLVNLAYHLIRFRNEREERLPYFKSRRKRRVAKSNADVSLKLLQAQRAALEDKQNELQKHKKYVCQTIPLPKEKQGFQISRYFHRRWPPWWTNFYDAACILAVSIPQKNLADNKTNLPDKEETENIIQLLKLAIEEPSCDLEFPSETIAKDPDLRHMRQDNSFTNFIRERACQELEPGPEMPDKDDWYASLAPVEKKRSCWRRRRSREGVVPGERTG